MDGAPAAAPMLLLITAAQFGVHAFGWTMAAFLFRRPAGPEGHFAAFWFANGLALAVFLLPLPAFHPVRALGDVLLLASALLVYRGLLLFYRQPLHDRVSAAVAVAVLLAIAGGLLLPPGSHVRIAGGSMLLALALAAPAALLWRHGRRQAPVLVLALLAPLLLLIALLLLRVLAVFAAAQPTRWLLDANSLQASLFLVAVFALAGFFNLVQIRLVLGGLLERLLLQSRHDELTGVANRRGALVALKLAHERARRHGGRYGVLMIDIDHFKAINDAHGHAAGDAALVRVAQLLHEGLRSGDLVARWGGEEFCVLMPRGDADSALQLAERLRAAVAAGTWPPLTISLGVALVDAAGETLEQGLARADAALYAAKQRGRDRVERADEPGGA